MKTEQAHSRSSWRPAAAAVLLPLAWAAPAQAQRVGIGAAVAEDYFRQANAAMQAKDYAKACPLFAESMKQDPQLGTLLNLARCHELEGKTASAWGEYNEVVVLAGKAGQRERLNYAKDAAAKLEERLKRVTIEVKDAAKGEVLKLDGTLEIGAGVWGKPTPMDPGPHKIEASAPGRQPETVSFTTESAAAAIVVPRLREEATLVAAETPSEGGGGRRTLAFVLMGGGFAGLTAGVVTGLMYLGKRSDYDACAVTAGGVKGFCPDPDRPDDPAAAQRHDASLRDGASTMGVVSTIALGVGVAGAALGAFFFFTSSPSGAKRARGLRLGPGVAAISF